jgi:hypothetical protein
MGGKKSQNSREMVKRGIPILGKNLKRALFGIFYDILC